MSLKPGEEERIRALDSAIELAASGKVDEALRVIKSDAECSDALAQTVVELAGRVGQMLETIRTDDWACDSILHDLAAVLADENQFERAKELATQIRNKVLRSCAFSAIAISLAEAGRLEEALNTLAEIGVKYKSAHTLTEIAIQMAVESDPQKALDLARQIEDESIRLLAFERMAIAFLERGLVDYSLETLELVRAEGLELPSQARAELAKSFAYRGEFYRALQIVTSMDDDDLRSWVLDEMEQALLKSVLSKQFEEIVKPSAKVEEACGDV